MIIMQVVCRQFYKFSLPTELTNDAYYTGTTQESFRESLGHWAYLNFSLTLAMRPFLDSLVGELMVIHLSDK